MDLLKEIPARVRQWIYIVYGLVGLIVGAIAVAYAAVDAAAPDWFRITLAVYALVGPAVGVTAGSNVIPAGPNPTPPGDI